MISANNVTYRVGKKALFEDVNIKFTVFCIDGVLFLHNLIETSISHNNCIYNRILIILKVILFQNRKTLSWRNYNISLCRL